MQWKYIKSLAKQISPASTLQGRTGRIATTDIPEVEVVVEVRQLLLKGIKLLKWEGMDELHTTLLEQSLSMLGGPTSSLSWAA